MVNDGNLTRPFGADALCWRISYSRDEGAVFIVESWVYSWIETYKNRPRKLTKLLEPIFDEYVKRKAAGSLN